MKCKYLSVAYDCIITMYRCAYIIFKEKQNKIEAKII